MNRNLQIDAARQKLGLSWLKGKGDAAAQPIAATKPVADGPPQQDGPLEKDGALDKDTEKAAGTYIPEDGQTSDTDVDSISKDAQQGVKDMEATTKVWSNRSLIMAYVMYVILNSSLESRR